MDIILIIALGIYIVILGIFIFSFQNKLESHLNLIKNSNLLLEKSYDKIKDFTFNNEKSYLTLLVFLISSLYTVISYKTIDNKIYYFEKPYIERIINNKENIITKESLLLHLQTSNTSKNNSQINNYITQHNDSIIYSIIFIILTFSILYFITIFLNTYSEYRLILTIIEEEKNAKNEKIKKDEETYCSIEYFLMLIKKYELDEKLTEQLCKNKKINIDH